MRRTPRCCSIKQQHAMYSLAARIACKFGGDKHIYIALDEFGHKAWDTVQLSFSGAKLNQNVFSLNITEISQPSPRPSQSKCTLHHDRRRSMERMTTRWIA